MLRNDLLDRDYYFEFKEPKKFVINAIWISLAVCSLIINISLFLAIYIDSFDNISIPYVDFNGYTINIIFIATPFIYFIFKDILTHLFCSNKKIYTEAKLSEKAEMPAWNCREAFKTWQILLIYLTPIVCIYPVLLGLGLISGGEINVLIVIFLMVFFMSHDLTLVIYVIFLKSKYNAEYIAINNHVYSLTLYSQNQNIKNKGNDLKILKRTEEKIYRKYLRKPVFFTSKRLSVIKIAGLIFICAGLLSGVIIYMNLNHEKEYDIYNLGDFDSYLEYCDGMKPVIKKYKGDIFSDMYHTTGNETGCEYLADHNIIYCSDDQSVIYFDGEQDSVMRLNNNDKAEKLCVYEDCRENPDEPCGHMIDFISNGCYSNGILYGAQSYSYADKKYGELLKCYILRYNIEKNKMDKLIEFEKGDENAYIQNMFICGGYLYAVVSADDMTQLTVARIDLENEIACIVYSDEKDLGNRDKIMGLVYNKNFMFSMENGTLYNCGLDLAKFTKIFSFGYGSFDIYNPDIYYLDCGRIYGYLFDDNKKIYKTELLRDVETYASKTVDIIKTVKAFCIDGDFLYYTIIEYHYIKNSLGVAVSDLPEMYEDNIIYRAKLDNNREIKNIDFYNKVAFYHVDKKYYLKDWSIKNGYIYTLLYPGNGNEMLSRVKENSNAVPYIFWERP